MINAGINRENFAEIVDTFRRFFEEILKKILSNLRVILEKFVINVGVRKIYKKLGTVLKIFEETARKLIRKFWKSFSEFKKNRKNFPNFGINAARLEGNFGVYLEKN